MIPAVGAFGEASLVDQLRDHHQPHPTQWRQAAQLQINAGNRATGLIALQAAIMNFDLQPIIGTNAADIDA